MGTAILDQLRTTANLFGALGDENRLRVLLTLRAGERCVCEMTEAFGLSQSLMSFHLKTLRDAGLIRQRRSGRWSYYSLEPSSIQAIEGFVTSLHDQPRALRTLSQTADLDLCCSYINKD